jgi:xylan 1,4-beta-xylosidase
MFARMSGQRLEVESDHAASLDTMLAEGVRVRPDVSALATIDDGKLSVLVWHYHDDDLPGPSADVTLTLADLPASSMAPMVKRFQIDSQHSNAYTAWRLMGQPQNPTRRQYLELERHGGLAEIAAPKARKTSASNFSLTFSLPRQAVSLIECRWAPTPTAISQ